MFKVGDRVRVKASVVRPEYDWGKVKKGEIGVVTRLVGLHFMKVHFPSQRNWSGYAPEMELVKDKPKAKKLKPKVEANNPPKKPFTAKDIHNRPVYAQLKASAVDARTLTKLVKAYLVNLNNMPDAENKFVQRTAAVISSFNWGETPEGNAFWSTIQDGRPVKFEDIKPKAVKKAAPKPPRQVPAAPVAQPPIGRGERPEGATHWHDIHGKWLKVDVNGVVYWWKDDEEWRAYINQNLGKERVRGAMALEPIAEMLVVKGRAKPAVEQPVIEEVKEPAPRIGWW